MRKLAYLFICLLALPAAGQTWSGSGTPNDPYQIWDACDMQAIGADANYWEAHFKLMADIDLSIYTGEVFNIIGRTWGNPFRGVFDGNNHKITNFSYSASAKGYIGLFGYVAGEGAKITNLGLTDVNIDARGCDDVGSLVGYLNSGTVSGCYAKGSNVIGDYYVGGLVGESYYGSISNCFTAVTVIGEEYFIGGLVGHNDFGNICDCYVIGDVLGNSIKSLYVGGLVGDNDYGDIFNCYTVSKVEGEQLVGGLIGGNWSSMVSGSYAVCTVFGHGYLGGLVGVNDYGDINDCYATGTVSGRVYIGGLIGRTLGVNVRHSYSASNVSGFNFIGGLVGKNITQAFYDYKKCFWDSTVNPSLAGIGNTTDPNVIGKTTTQMQDANTYINAGWDFNTPIWKMCEFPDYPKLWWEECPVLEPEELIAALLEEVGELELPGGIENSLMAKLNSALAALEDENENNDAAAVNTLEAFINAVETHRGKKIPEEVADELIAAAQQIIDLLSYS